MESVHHRIEPVPKPIIALGVLLLAVLVTVAWARWSGIGAPQTAESTAVAQRSFQFEDRGDGSIVVIDAASGRTVDTLAPGTNGFLRSTMRGLARERRQRGIGAAEPFWIRAHQDGRITLDDPLTRRHIDLAAFGAANASAFARLLHQDIAAAADAAPTEK
jgi:putative photosynthetic complex assembly protein